MQQVTVTVLAYEDLKVFHLLFRYTKLFICEVCVMLLAQ